MSAIFSNDDAKIQHFFVICKSRCDFFHEKCRITFCPINKIESYTRIYHISGRPAAFVFIQRRRTIRDNIVHTQRVDSEGLNCLCPEPTHRNAGLKARAQDKERRHKNNKPCLDAIKKKKIPHSMGERNFRRRKKYSDCINHLLITY